MRHFTFLQLSSTLTVLLVSVSAFGALKEHPVIRPYPGAVLLKDSSEYQEYSTCEMPCLDNGKNQVRKSVGGEYWQLYYETQDAGGARNEEVSVVDFLENYKAAALEKGGKVQFEDAHNGFLTFTLPREDGGTTWCYVEASPGLYGLWIVDEKAFEKKLTFSAEEMKKALDAQGHVAVYGILFDTDKAFLKPESVVTLQEIVRLMLQNPTLSVEVQGHTDDQGADEHNMTLSDNRAKTVCQYLALFGIAADRMTPRGYGETTPVAPNDTEDGRARNRRVELVRR